MKKNYFITLSFVFLFLTIQTQAQIFVNSNASGANDGTSWTSAYTSLQDAIAAATSGDEVWVAQGTYYPDEGTAQTDNDRNATFQLKNGVTLYGGFTGNETQLSERDWIANETILSGDINQSGDFTGNTLTVVTGSGTDATAIIDGFTITRGNENVLLIGAGMINISGSPTIRNNKFINNKGVYGTGLFNQNASPNITNCSFIANEASQRGGGMLNKSSSFPQIINCVFTGNSAGDAGGGMFNEISSVPVITNSTFTSNTANNNGGAILNDNASPIITNTIIWGNTANGVTTSASASVFNANSANPEFTYSLIANSGGSASWTSSIGTDNGNNIDANPQFNDANNNDFRLQFGSPAINAGTPDLSGLNLPAEDFSGNPRVSDGTIDMGAFEFQKLPISPSANNILYVNQSAVIGNQSGDSWENATLELRDALSWAENTWDGSNAPLQIWVAKGTYMPTDDGIDRNSFFQLVNNVEIYGGFNGNETSLNQRNFTTHETILSGDIDADETLQNNSYTIVNGSGTDATAVLDGFSITKGNADGVTEITARGAGMYNDAGSPEVSNCKFSGNSAVFGGGVYNVNNSSPSISNCSILDNQATASGGGLLNINSSPFVVNALFTGNSADNGGGLFNDATSSAIVTNTTFSENTAVFNGGAIFNGNSNPNLTNIIVWNNTANGITTSASSSVFNSTSSPIISFSLIANSGGSVSWDSNIGTDDGNNIDTDPLFKDSTNGDFALNDNSPAKNAGTPDVTVLNLPAIDLAGNPRIFDGIIDMGAFENQIACPSANILYVSASATGNNLGTSWADAYNDLQDALDNNCAGVTEIWVAAGTYKPSKYPANCNGCNSPRDNTFQLKDGIALYGGFDGTETSLSDRVVATNETILSGDFDNNDVATGSVFDFSISNNAENAYHVVLAAFPLNDNTSSTRLDGFTITGGNANGNENISVNGLNFSKDNGGGIYTLFGNNTIVNNRIELCQAGFWGGGMFLNRSISIITNNTISFNDIFSLSNAAGVGVYVLFGVNTFENNTITNNNSSLSEGGGIFIRESNSTLINNLISMNSVGLVGGGIKFEAGNNILTNNTITNNTSSIGGGISFQLGTNTLTNNQINNNEANLGGGIFSGTTFGEDLPDNGTFIFTDNTISGNTSNSQGGGASMNRGNYTFTNNTISNNAAEEGGGGFFIRNSTTAFNDNTISGNSINSTSGIAGGGLVFLNGSNTLSNNTIADNTATNAAGILFQGGTNNLIGNRFSGNTANESAGGIFIFQGTNTLTNNSFYNNTAAIGGGIYLEEGTNALVNNSITGNIASTNGGGMYFENSSPTITNTIIWNNTVDGSTTTASASVFNENSTPTFSHNLIANSGGSASWATALGTDGGNNIDIDPLFSNPATNDFSLQKGSLAINAGDNAAYQSATGNDPASDTDLAGNPRLFQSTIDMGAFEADFKQSQWRGTVSEDWANNSNWDEDVPDDQSVALIRDISLNTPHISATTQAEASDLILAENTALKVNGVLKVTETINNNGQITFTSNATKTGQLDTFTGTYSGPGQVTVERYIPAGSGNAAGEPRRAYRFLTSAVNSSQPIFNNWQQSGLYPGETGFQNNLGTHITGSAGSVGDTDPITGFDYTSTGNPSMFTFNNTVSNQDAAWEALPNSNSKNLRAGEAYLTLIRGDRTLDISTNSPTPTNTRLSATGSLITGDHILTSDNNATVPHYGMSTTPSYYNLIGNPYQAIVDLTEVLNATNSSNINTTQYWYWDPNLDNSLDGTTHGGYANVNISNGFNSNGSNANQFLMPGQAIFVQNSPTVSGPVGVAFTESAKNVAQIETAIFSEPQSSIKILLYRTTTLNNGGRETDGLALIFNDNGNNSIDEYDGTKMFNHAENLARVHNGNLLSIENRAMPIDDEILPLFTTGYTDNNYTFIANVTNIQDNFEAFLLDHYTGHQTQLNEGSTQINFTVDANIPASSASDRFSLVFDNTTLSINENNFGEHFSLFPNPTKGQFSIRTPNLSGQVQIEISNLLGQKISVQNLTVEAQKVDVNVENFSTGVYLVKLMQNANSYSSKLIVK